MNENKKGRPGGDAPATKENTDKRHQFTGDAALNGTPTLTAYTAGMGENLRLFAWCPRCLAYHRHDPAESLQALPAGTPCRAQCGPGGYEAYLLDVHGPAPGYLRSDLCRSRPRGPFTRKRGRIAVTLSNVISAVSMPRLCGYRFAIGTVGQGVVVAPDESEVWRPLTRADYIEVRLRLELHGFLPVGNGTVRDAIRYVAERGRSQA